MFWIATLIFLLYARTWNYNYVIDDFVKRDGYLYDIPMEGPSYLFWERKPSPWYRLFMISMHVVNTWIIYMLWGWCPALLFAVHPLGVWGTAWVTGNYYATTTYFILISYFILHTFPSIWGALVVLPIYAAALNSTITSIMFPFLFFFMGTPWGFTMFFPLVMFLCGKRFVTGMKIRRTFNAKHMLDLKITPRRLILMTKVVAKYIYIFFVPDKLGFFSAYEQGICDYQDKYNKLHSADKEFWSALALCITVFIAGLMINPLAVFWFFVFIAAHSQFKIMGQFYAQRYMYLPMIGLCVLVGTALQQYPFVITVITTFLVIRTHLFIPAWRNQENVWRNDIEAFPDNGEAYSNLAQYYLSSNKPSSEIRLKEIILLMAKAMHLSPRSYMVYANMACLAVAVGNLDKALEWTDSAIGRLKAIGANTEGMYQQRGRIQKRIEEQKQGVLGDLLLAPKKGRDENGTRQRETEECVEYNGSRNN